MENSILPKEAEAEIQVNQTNYEPKKSQQLTDFEIAERMNRLMAGGRLRRKKQKLHNVLV